MIKKSRTKEEDHAFYKHCATLVDYDSNTGIFTWKFRCEKDQYIKTWNTKNAGNEIKTVSAQVYKFTSMKYLGSAPKILMHRLAWFIVYNEVPPNLIDHINQIKVDNRISNLRLSTYLENNKNQIMRNTNTSGITGVSWVKETSKWVAQCWVNSKRYYLGSFLDILEAEKVVKEFRKANGYTELHGELKSTKGQK